MTSQKYIPQISSVTRLNFLNLKMDWMNWCKHKMYFQIEVEGGISSSQMLVLDYMHKKDCHHRKEKWWLPKESMRRVYYSGDEKRQTEMARASWEYGKEWLDENR